MMQTAAKVTPWKVVVSKRAGMACGTCQSSLAVLPEGKENPSIPRIFLKFLSIFLSLWLVAGRTSMGACRCMQGRKMEQRSPACVEATGAMRPSEVKGKDVRGER